MFRPPPAGGAGLKAPTGRNAHDRVLLHIPPGKKVQFLDDARLGAARHHAERRAGKGTPTSGQFSSWWCTFRRPCHQAERPAGKGTPTSGRHSPPKAGGEKDPQVRGGPFSAGTSVFSVIRTAAWYMPFAALRAAVPTGGRRSRADGTIWTVGVPAWDCICTAKVVRHSRWQGLTSLVQVSRSRACRAPPGELPRGRRAKPSPRFCPMGATQFRGPVGRGAGLKAPTGRNAHDRVLLHTPPNMKVQFPGWCTSRPHATMQSDALARERRPLVGTARRRRAAEQDPEFGGGSLLGRDLGVQRHPDGCVVRAFRCAPRSGADRRSAFPCGRHHLDRWGSRVGLHFHSKGGAALTLAGPDVIGAGFALPRVPGSTGRTAQRSACQAVPALLPDGRYAVSRPCGPRCRSESPHREKRS